MRNQKGITLIALVITIIVLLILAGVSIAMLTGENGILTNATESQQKTDYRNAKEKIDIALSAIKTEALAQMVADNQYAPEDHASELTAATVIGSGMTTSDGYTITTTSTASDGIIKISYSNTATKVEVEGSIDLDANTSGGLITEATGTIDEVEQDS